MPHSEAPQDVPSITELTPDLSSAHVTSPRPTTEASKLSPLEHLVASHYLCSSRLAIYISPADILEVEVIKPFKPTSAQVVVARQTQTATLPTLLIVKVFDPLAIKRAANDPKYSLANEAAAAERRADESQPLVVRSMSFGHPDLEDDEGRLAFSWGEYGGVLYAPEDEEDDPVVWEEYFFKLALQQYHKERISYGKLQTLQGDVIPRCYGTGRLNLPDRPIMPRVILLEYVQDAPPIDWFRSLSPIHKRMLAVDGPDADAGIYKQFWKLGVIHHDIGSRQILVKRDRLVVLDFGLALVREPEDSDELWDDLYFRAEDFTFFVGEDERTVEISEEEFSKVFDEALAAYSSGHPSPGYHKHGIFCTRNNCSVITLNSRSIGF
ncbi:hypothetical protein EIP91_012177 [Steccherinum ochraceum]|uniref:Protein kinase domain-containing protein n=1 Tax=Steccherinum ochraceum TaxID=92696 RepID=A0A4R0RKF7_9APHY|nr:hypothetical protein EIP91_012177 [Steccherinum ochraceum]